VNPTKANRPAINLLIRMLCVATASLLFVGTLAQAGFIVTLDQVGSNVVATGSGAIDLTGLTFILHASSLAGINPGVGAISLAAGNTDGYGGFSGPSSFGIGGPTLASSSSGDPISISNPTSHLGLFVPRGYSSGRPLSGSSTYDNATFSSLEVRPGTYEWTWGTGANQNFTLKIGAAALPDTSSTFGLLFLTLTGLFGVSRVCSVRLA
jgi:hypothetical protein